MQNLHLSQGGLLNSELIKKMPINSEIGPNKGCWVTGAATFHYSPAPAYTECPKIYRKSVLHYILFKYRYT